ncbi:D-glycerate dehydrogenase [Gudongella oleilytica]|uniref:2-hydroxyacid dehydrogenase n=1 Tax=Gudongella oleilytica TaxID=1582259 RepID=UPI002A35E644|nr:D-glycerate dehydrogenase [Gudongella oleilytica]MDY0255830.1 D-glycerate dehydrogenase [Gudongella oleilytica]
MSKPKAVIAYPVPEEVVEFVREHCDLKVLDFSKPVNLETIKDEIRDAEGMVILGLRIDDQLLDHTPKLKVASNITVGYNNCDVEAMKKRSVLCTHSPGVLDETVADFVMGLMISAARRLPELDTFTKEGKWVKGDMSELFGRDVHHSTLGIIGMGRIGEAVARRAKFGFEMDVIYYNRSRKEAVEKELGITYKPMDELLAEADFLVTLTPLTAETAHLIGERELDLMKEGSFVINASRGPVIDEEALIKALQSGKLAGAGLDVFEKEPLPKDSPLLSMKNVVTTPHIAAGTHQTMANLAWSAARSMVEVLETGTSKNIVPEMK